MTRPSLAVWLYGTRLAELAEDTQGRLLLKWTSSGYQRWGTGSRVMSYLLPIARSSVPSPPRVKAFVDGLLPEGTLRTNWAIDLGIDPDDTFGLIARYGRDTAGALVFTSRDESEPDRAGAYEPISGKEAGQLLRAATRQSPAEVGGVQSTSLAGMHPKIAVHRVGGEWLRCRAGAPSTWILKLGASEGAAADVLDTEVLCNELARRIGLATTKAEIVHLGDVRAIAVERYDRVIAPDGSIARIHQEDLAQTLGLNTSDPDRKFQRGRKLPSLLAAANVLRAGGADGIPLLRLMTFSHLVGNTDMHAKNISFIRREDGTATLAPPYDVSSHMHHRATERISALYVNDKARMDEITTRDLSEETRSWRLPGLLNREFEIGSLGQKLDAALARVDRDAHPGVSDEAFDTIKDRVQAVIHHVDLLRDRPGRKEETAASRRSGPRSRR